MPEITKTYPHPSQSASLILSGLEQVSGTLAFFPDAKKLSRQANSLLGPNKHSNFSPAARFSGHPTSRF